MPPAVASASRSSIPAKTAPLRSAKILARCDFPDLAGPVSRVIGSGQCGNAMIRPCASALPSPARKSLSPCAVVWPRSSVSWPVRVSVSGFVGSAIRTTILPAIERAGLIFGNPIAYQHRGDSGHRHRQKKADKAEQCAQTQQGKHHPHRVDVDRGADQLGVKNIALDELPEEEDPGHQ